VSFSPTSLVLATALLVFVGVASGVLVWDGLATGLGKRAAAAGVRVWRARLRFAIGVVGFGLALWFALGLLNRAW
jgi:hypothetical protein